MTIILGMLHIIVIHYSVFNIIVKMKGGEVMKDHKTYEKPKMEKVEFSFDAAWKKSAILKVLVMTVVVAEICSTGK